jgi:hypothetical protein
MSQTAEAMQPLSAPPTIVARNCTRCANEVWLPPDRPPPWLCEGCDPALLAALKARRDAVKQRVATEKQKREATFEERRLKVLEDRGGPLKAVGSRSTAKCPRCRKPYVYDANQRLQHDGECHAPPRKDGAGQTAATPKAADLPQVRRTWHDRDDEDDE